MFLMQSKPVWAPEGDGGAAPDASATMYPDDQPVAAGTVAETAPEGTPPAPETPPVADPVAADPLKPAGEAAEWAEYVDDPAKTPEENAAARVENDAKHPINQVPEDGKYSLTMPEGIELDTALLDALGPTFKELNLSNGHAQALADKFIEAQRAKSEQATAQWAETINGWADKAKADPEMGGGKWDKTLASAISARDRFGSPALNEYLEASGAGNHPEVIRFMAKVGSMIGEDNPAISDNPGRKVSTDSASILYPDDTPKGK